MTPATPRLISSAPSIVAAPLSFPPKPPILKPNLSPKIQNNRIEISRRDVVLLTFLTLVPSVTQSAPANAFSIGISGPKEWLKEQKRKSSKFVLAPIDASRQILNSAYLLLKAKESDYTEKDLEEVQDMFRSAAKDCVPQERNSFVAFQANTGVEMANFELKLRQNRTIITEVGNLSRQLPNLPPGFLIQLSVHHQNNNSKPDMFFYVLDTVFLYYQGMVHFLCNILAGEGIQVPDDGLFLSPNRLQLFPQTEPIYTVAHLAECVLNYAWWMRNNNPLVNIVPIAMDLTISSYQHQQQFHFDPVDETFILESLPAMAPAVRLVEGIIQDSCTEDCSICLERFDVGQLTCCTPCAHIFHKKCIAPWVVKSQSCPLCRANLSLHS